MDDRNHSEWSRARCLLWTNASAQYLSIQPAFLKSKYWRKISIKCYNFGNVYELFWEACLENSCYICIDIAAIYNKMHKLILIKMSIDKRRMQYFLSLDSFCSDALYWLTLYCFTDLRFWMMPGLMLLTIVLQDLHVVVISQLELSWPRYEQKCWVRGKLSTAALAWKMQWTGPSCN